MASTNLAEEAILAKSLDAVKQELAALRWRLDQTRSLAECRGILAPSEEERRGAPEVPVAITDIVSEDEGQGGAHTSAGPQAHGVEHLQCGPAGEILPSCH